MALSANNTVPQAQDPSSAFVSPIFEAPKQQTVTKPKPTPTHIESRSN